MIARSLVVAAALLGPAARAQPQAIAPAPVETVSPAPRAGGDDEPDLSSLLDSRIDPTSPAFTLLGVSPSDIVRPETPQSLALGLLNGLDQRGNFQSGLSVEFTPATFFFGDHVTLRRYRDEYYGPFGLLTRVRVSLGVAAGSDKDKSARASVGLVWTPIDGADPKAPGPREMCRQEVDREFRGGVADPQKPESVERRKAREAANDACRVRFSLRPDKVFALQFGFAPLFVSKTGETDDFKSQGYAASVTASIGLTDLFFPKQAAAGRAVGGDSTKDKRRSRLILTGTYREDEVVPDPDVDETFLERDRWTIGGRFEFGGAERAMLGLEAIYQNADYELRERDKFATIVGTLDVKVSDGLWLGVHAGTSNGRAVEKDDLFIGTRFRWAFNKKTTSGLF